MFAPGKVPAEAIPPRLKLPVAWTHGLAALAGRSPHKKGFKITPGALKKTGGVQKLNRWQPAAAGIIFQTVCGPFRQAVPSSGPP